MWVELPSEDPMFRIPGTKGGKQHSHSLPVELLEYLKVWRLKSATELIVSSIQGRVLPYKWNVETLSRYCEKLEIPIIGSHGLRHSTSELYIHHGATRDDMRRLFAHSAPSVTDLYVHDRGTILEKVAKVILLFPGRIDTKSTPWEDLTHLVN